MAFNNPDTRHNDLSRSLRRAAAGSGAIFLLVGIMGFIPGLTSNYDQLLWAGHESGAVLLGIFQVSILHNIIHLAFGVAGLLMSRTARGARTFLIGGGASYAVILLYGLLVDQTSGANFIPVNNADNWLHLALSAGMIAMGLILGRHAAGLAAPQSPVTPQAR